jgi:hypothetical protein
MEKLNQVMDALIGVIKSSAEFAGSQLPDIAQQACAYELASSTTWLILLVVLIVLLVGFLALLILKDSDDGVGLTLSAIIVLAMLSGVQIMDIIKVKTAPKVYVMEYFIDKVKSVRNEK